MIKKFLQTIFGTKDDREVKRILKQVAIINSLEKDMKALSDDNLKLQTSRLRDRLASGESLDEILPEAFATVREAAIRVLGLRPYDVQMVGGIVLHEGKIAEMRTGEGKTLVATAPVYLNALTGKGVHVITVNDYLAKRDKEWMGRIYQFLGLTTGVVLGQMSPEERKIAYNADITYGTNNEFGFDYLRDNMAQSFDQMVQRTLNYAIVDEVDSILIDEARTPLIISGSARESLRVYELFAGIVKQLGRDRDYEVNEKENSVLVKEEGIERVESILKIDNLYSEKNIEMTHYLNQALKAKELFKKDKDYIIRENQVIIVDEFTGRLMQGRRYSEGLHQSIEAKEKVPVAAENFTLATITLQNYFRMYNKLSGMTGTAKTEEGEFVHIYNLHVVTIPTNKPIARTDHSDMVYVTQKEKFEAAVDQITEIHKKGQPILIGTASIENSEMMSNILKQAKIKHNVLNAKQHASEAEIVAQAGRIGSVTIATNMAGRGTDIVLGGNAEFMAKHNNDDEDSEAYKKALVKYSEQFCKEKEQVLALGGLYILGTERHESRRIDNQLRGRSGRQGDPGEATFFLSLEDELMRMFGSERVMNIMEKMGYEYKEVLQHSMLNKAIENAQKRVEARNFGIRKQLLEYDDVINKQREVVYGQRSDIMHAESVTEKLHSIIGMVVQHAVNIYMNIKDSNLRDVEGFVEFFKDKFVYEVPADMLDKDPEMVVEKITKDLIEQYEKKMETHSHKNEVEKQIMIQVLDGRWRENLRTLDALREGIHLRSYGQRDPIVEYKLASSRIYKDMINLVREEIASFLSKLEE